jgi:hypothetical protein
VGTPAVNTLTINEPPAPVQVQFSAGSETLSASAGTFRIPVTLSGGPSTQTVTVPFTLSGTAVAGAAVSGVTASPLTFAVGQTTQNITGTLLSEPGLAQTLTLILGTPTGGATLGSAAVNTLTITEPAPPVPTVQFSTGSETVDQSTGTFSIPVTLSGSSTQTVTVPFTLGGSAVAGTDYSGVTASPLTFAAGQTTGNITGTLVADPGPSRTLILTLGTPTGGAMLGSSTVNTLTITEPAAASMQGQGQGQGQTQSQTQTGSAVPPVFTGEQRVFSQKGKQKKLVGFEFLWSDALDVGRAQSTGNYHVTQNLGKKAKVLPVKSALYNPSNFSVTISVGGFQTGKAAQVTIAGLAGANGATIPQIVSGL